MSDVWSRPLARFNTVAGVAWRTWYSTPAGYVTIVRELRVSNLGAAAKDVTLAILVGATRYQLDRIEQLGAGDTAVLPCWLVGNPGDVWQVFQSASTSLDIVASGYELSTT